MGIQVLELSVCEYWHAQIVFYTPPTTPFNLTVLKHFHSASDFNVQTISFPAIVKHVLALKQLEGVA